MEKMKLLTRLYNWLSNTKPFDPKTTWGKIKEHRARRMLLNSNPEFLLWAFGDHHEHLCNIDKVNYWNLTHGDLFKIDHADQLPELILKMGSLWTEHVATNKK
jgi:hypothetical protein